MQIEAFIQEKANLPFQKIKATLALLSEGATIPFIARYRKERTGALDEVEIAEIKDQKEKYEALIGRKDTILKAIEEQGKLDAILRQRIEDCYDPILLEDIYLPYKRKRKTRADKAREKGLEPMADMVWAQKPLQLHKEAKAFLNDEVLDLDDAIEGVKDILAERINLDDNARNILRKQFSRSAIITSKVKKSKKEEASNFADYFDFSISLKKCPSHTYLALRRGEDEGFLSVQIEPPIEEVLFKLENIFIIRGSSTKNILKEAIEDSYKRLLFPSIENEFRKTAQEKADAEAIEVFVSNLRQLLLAPPLGTKTTLAIDPGFRTGCKVVVLSDTGEFITDTVIYPHPPQNKMIDSIAVLQKLIDKYKVEAIAVGNGTAGKETMNMCLNLEGAEVYMVNEAGASIYSASEVAREEFPNFDITVRGAISIGRRLMDPLAELVKVPAKSIGVGQYQHDVDQVKLKLSLDRAVESCVNAVGVNLNTASKHLLTYVAGLGPTLATNIVAYRSENGHFMERKELMKIPRMGQKAFEQCAGFLRIKNGKNPLDNTGVHPERYAVVKEMVKTKGLTLSELLGNEKQVQQIDFKSFEREVGSHTLQDIVKELKKPGLDARGKAKTFHFATGVNTIDDLSVGMVVPGLVTNITKFGAFVSIGVKQDGLVHISEIANQFVDDPQRFLKLNQAVRVKVIGLQKEKNRINLSIKQAD